MSQELYHNELFKGKKVLVTGGRSGIGYGIAKRYLTLGAEVIISSRKKDLLENAAHQLNEFGRCYHFPCDIRDTVQVSGLCEFIQQGLGQIDILINNAGGQFPAPSEWMSSNGWNAVINNNLNGTFYVTQAIAKQFMIPQNRGLVVNIIASVMRGLPGMAHTAAARAGVENLTKTLAQEWATYGIRLNAIAPGIIRSSGLDTYPEQIKAYFTEFENENLMKRLGEIEDIANAVMFLSSPLSSYISGTTMYVDGLDHLSMGSMKLINTLRELAK